VLAMRLDPEAKSLTRMITNPNFNHYVIHRQSKQIIAGFTRSSDAEQLANLQDDYIIVGRQYIADTMPQFSTRDPLDGWDAASKFRAMSILKKRGRGGFSSQLADAWMIADRTNQRRIEEAFWFLFMESARFPEQIVREITETSSLKLNNSDGAQ
jgi:hypothetical protein